MGFIITNLIEIDTANIVTIDVDPIYRKQGIGSILLKAVKEILDRKNLTKITLQVSVSNSIAIRFYLKQVDLI